MNIRHFVLVAMSSTILTLTMNPAVDVCAAVDRITPGHKLRCGLVRRDPGGGGINVARVIRRFGDDPLAVFPSGGPIGGLLEHLAAAESVACVPVPIAGDTREDFAIDEIQTGQQYRFVLPGPFVTEAEQGACLAATEARLAASGHLVASGSLPPGVPADFYARVARAAVARKAKFFLDTSAAALKAALGSGVHLIKPSLHEFEELMRRPLTDHRARIDAARRLISAGACEFAALSLGEEGALLVGAQTALHARAPKVTPVSTIGAGDSFLGALVLKRAHGHEWADCLRFAVAAGAAALLSPGTDLCHPRDCDRLLRDVTVTAIDWQQPHVAAHGV